MGLAPWGTDVSGGGGPAFILQDFFKELSRDISPGSWLHRVVAFPEPGMRTPVRAARGNLAATRVPRTSI